jgi:hypothetical protein
MPSLDVGLGRNMDKWSMISDDHETRVTFDVYAVLIKSRNYGKKFLIIDKVFPLSLIQIFGVI